VGEPDDPLPDDLPALEAAARGEATPTPQPAPAQDAATSAKPAPPAPAPTPTPAPQPIPVAPPPSGRILISPRARRLALKEKVPASILRGTGPNGRIVEKDVLAYLEKRKAIRVTPAAKAIALERGVDVTLVKGTGPAGRVTRDDVLAAAPPARPAAPVPGRMELSAMRRVVAQRMSLSKREAPHFYLLMDIDMTDAVKVRKRANDTGDVRVGFHDMIIRACAIAMAEQPAMNVTWDNGAILQRGDINIGLAVAIDEGLMVPVVKNADRLALADIARRSRSLIEKARTKKLIPDEYEGGCLTVSNLGMFDVDAFLPIINPGESAILGVGRIVEKPVVINGGIHVRAVMTASLSADHRCVDGAIAAAYLKRVKDLLEAPEQLL